MQMHTPGDAGHSVLNPDAGDYQGDRNIADGSFFDDPLAAITSAAKRFPSYGNWSGPDNAFDRDIKAKYADAQARGTTYDPATDPTYGRGTAVDGLDAAAREHDFGYYHDNFDPTTGQERAGMFSLEGLENTRNADRKLADDAAREMATPSIGPDGKPIVYSADTRLYADGMQGFFGGRADGVDLRNDYMAGKIDGWDVATGAVDDVAKAYNHNGLFGATCEGLALANVGAVSAYDSASTAVSSAASTVASTASDVWDWVTN
ncbi:MAG: hypothetical protein K8W52_12230 [Deltaproteobacteria bacterium]|nr:hypothetical protein [Deltaproteobacteria bacterium]